MEKETKTRIEALESTVEILTAKLNEVIACLDDNKISRKVGVDYIYKDGEEVENTEETLEEATEEAIDPTEDNDEEVVEDSEDDEEEEAEA